MNVILIVNDTFRRDHLGCYGNPWIKTPNLDAFAQRSAVFEQYYIASYPTVPNRWDMLTGRYGFPTRGWQPLDPTDVTLAQILAHQGVHTQMIWDTPMLARNDYNYTRGFQGLYFSHSQKGDPWITAPDLPIQFKAQPHKIKNLNSMANYWRNHHGRKYEREYCVARTMIDAMEWLETNHDQESFFLYIDMWDPHEPFDCPWYDYQLYGDPSYSGDWILYPQYGRNSYLTKVERQNARDMYAGQVTLVDRWVGRFLDMAERLGLFKNTLILWTTDHGHLFGEHGLRGKSGAELGKLYEITTRIPLLAYHPEGRGAGQRVQGIVQPPDLFTSILDFMKAPIPSGIDGRSFWSLLEGKQIHDYAFSCRFPPNAADPSYSAIEGAIFDGWAGSDRIVEPSTITSNEWAYICTPRGLPSELYNLKDDSDQLVNLIETHPHVAERLHAEWIDFLRAHGASDARIRPFVEGNTDVHTPTGGTLFAFRDDHGQWIAFATEQQARMAAYQENAPGPKREVREVTFGDLLADNPKNLIQLHDQYYWAEDLA